MTNDTWPSVEREVFAELSPNNYHRQMMIEDLEEALREVPAGPFVVHIAEKTPIEVLHTDFVMRSPTGRTFSVWDTDRHLHHIATEAITRISHTIAAEQADS